MRDPLPLSKLAIEKSLNYWLNTWKIGDQSFSNKIPFYTYLHRLDIIPQKQIFTNTLNFVSISLSITNEICSISDAILDRLCIDMLPRIHNNIKSPIIESISLKRILLTANYPNLTEFQILNFPSKKFACELHLFKELT
ncbi:unnamed protein product [Rotaria magnacalcarata]